VNQAPDHRLVDAGADGDLCGESRPPIAGLCLGAHVFLISYLERGDSHSTTRFGHRVGSARAIVT
jgi:hypothetical protein